MQFLTQLGLPETPARVLVAVIAAVILVTFVAVSAIFFIWLERKVAGRIQDRLGPTRVGGKFGWLQTLADGIKLLVKEDLIPGRRRPVALPPRPRTSPSAARSSPSSPCRSPTASVARTLNIGVFFMLAVMSTEVFGIILAGYGSGQQVVAVRRHARGGPGGQLRSADGHVRARAGHRRRHA